MKDRASALKKKDDEGVKVKRSKTDGSESTSEDAHLILILPYGPRAFFWRAPYSLTEIAMTTEQTHERMKEMYEEGKKEFCWVEEFWDLLQ